MGDVYFLINDNVMYHDLLIRKLPFIKYLIRLRNFHLSRRSELRYDIGFISLTGVLSYILQFHALCIQ